MTPSLQCPAPVLRPGAQGIARVAVDDVNAQLTVTFHRPVTQAYLLNPRSYTLTGGQRLFPRVLEADLVGAMSVLLTLDQTGDFSIYTLTVSGADIDPFSAATNSASAWPVTIPSIAAFRPRSRPLPRSCRFTSTIWPRTIPASARRCSTSFRRACPNGPSATKLTSA